MRRRSTCEGSAQAKEVRIETKKCGHDKLIKHTIGNMACYRKGEI